MHDLQQSIKKYLKERGWDNLRPADLSKSISIESAELLEIFQWTNPSLDDTKKDKKLKEKISDELADVLIYCLDMVTLLDLDAEKIVKEKLKFASEKYPPELVKNTNGKEPGTDEAYLKIKRNYRRKGLS